MQAGFRVRKRGRLDVRKAQEDDRPLSLLLPHGQIFPDPQPLKEFLSAGIFVRKEAVQHGHVQRLAEASGAGDQGDSVPVLPPFTDEIRLVHVKISVYPKTLEILYSYADYTFHPYPAPSEPPRLFDVPAFRTLVKKSGFRTFAMSMLPSLTRCACFTHLCDGTCLHHCLNASDGSENTPRHRHARVRRCIWSCPHTDNHL